jgi:endonuclease/exonuclease/phosphatase (EEP) superfamily protein YafD
VTFFTTAFSPYLMLLGPVSVVLLILARRWLLTAAATGLTAAILAVQLPMFFPSHDAGPSEVALRVISANIYLGQADAASLVTSANTQADVIGFQELTPDAVKRLSSAGLDETFPYRWVDAREGASGVGLWSRFPLEATKQIGGLTFAALSAQVRVPGVSANATVAVVHVAGPWPYPINYWSSDFGQLPDKLTEVAQQASGGCVIVPADLNSTVDMEPFRGLLRDGYGDAAEQAGAGFEPTYPGDLRIPPVVAIDHILTRNCTATSLHTIEIPGSDHRGLVATVMIPPSPPTS